MDSLFTLAILLTGDRAKAEQCFTGALEDCLSTKVFRSAKLSWTRLAVIERAMQTMKPLEVRGFEFRAGEDLYDDPRLHPDGRRVLALNVFERFVFVMSVLERYSLRDCAVLLKCTLREVRDARLAALEAMVTGANQIIPSPISAAPAAHQI